jgi:hypothetical protein
MKKMSGILLVLCLGLGTALTTAAQDKSVTMLPPKVLNVIREVLKPGKGGAAHERTESAFVKAMIAAKSTDYYFALDSLTGPSRTLFFSGSASYAEWEKTQLGEQHNATLSAALDRAAEADGDLLQTYESGSYILNEDQSYNISGGLAGARYFSIEVYSLKPGHDADWDAIVKLVKPALIKANPDNHWAMYERYYGGHPAFVVMRSMKSLGEIDRGIMDDPKFFAAMGDDGMKKLGELTAAAVESQEANLFAINPRISYVSPEMAAADPFWKVTQ